MSKKISIMGAGAAGIRPIYSTLACILMKHGHTVVQTEVEKSNPLNDLRLPEPFVITKLPEVPGPYVNSFEPVFNHHKHQQSCHKKRKKERTVKIVEND